MEPVSSREKELDALVATLTERVETLEKRANGAFLDSVMLAREVRENHVAMLLTVGVVCVLTGMILRRHKVAIDVLGNVLTFMVKR